MRAIKEVVIHSFDKYLLSTLSRPSILLDASGIAVNKIEKIPTLVESLC